MNHELSAVICTHDPRPDYLRRTLAALKAQTLSRDKWELLVVDNASKEPLEKSLDLGWHPGARIIREEQLGHMPVRLRSIREFKGKNLLWVDDDNIVAENYLELALKIGNSRESLGAWGGNNIPEFETPPPEWTKPFWSYLALRSEERAFWSKDTSNYGRFPCGAGMTMRRDVAETYAQNVGSSGGKWLGRKGKEKVLNSCEDTGMVLIACDLGYEYGVFPELRLAHIIPQWRLTEDYLSRLVEGSAFGTAILKAHRNGETPPAPDKPWWRRRLGVVRRRLMFKRADRLMLEANMRGWERAKAVLNQAQTTRVA